MYNKYRGGSSYGGGRGRFSRNSSRSRSASTPSSAKYIKKAVAPGLEVAPVVTKKFEEFGLNPNLERNIVNKGYLHTTPIQEGTIAHVIEGRDVIGIANTGTGKTGAFLIPLLHTITLDKNATVLIVVPTRELATQVSDEMRMFAQGMNIYSTVCIGGASMGAQISELRRDPHMVIGTPGRLKDLIERKALNPALFTTIVLDEVDRMLDMGFIQDIRYLISLLPPKRQSLFFSATISSEINSLIQSFVRNPVTVSVKKEDTAANVDQDIVRVQAGAQKMDVLEDLLKKQEFKKVLIFGRTKRGVERLSVSLFAKGFKVASIHGDKPQFKRNQAIRLFKEDRINILVATDVASRGIDITDITHVINFDQPATYDDYVHRIGRTGRANKKGIALTFVE